jgi:drug/metabolite transporter (DMT)-like permease
MIAAGLLALVCIYFRVTGGLDIGGATALVTAAVLWAVYTVRLPRAGVTSLQAAALICFWSAILYLPLYLRLSLSSLTHASEGELVFQSIYQGIMMSVVALFAFNRAVVLLGPRAAAVIIALMPVVATLLAIPVLDEWPSWPSAAAIFIIALGVALAATSSNQDNKKGESQ